MRMGSAEPRFGHAHARSINLYDLLTRTTSETNCAFASDRCNLGARHRIKVVPTANLADQVAALVEQYTTSRSLGIFGEPRVNVLELNLAVEKAFPKK
jgi:K+-transporting ATPase c subunit